MNRNHKSTISSTWLTSVVSLLVLLFFSGQAMAAYAPTSALQNNFDRAAVEKELALQVSVTQQFSENVQYVQSQIRTHTDKLSRDAKAAEEAGDTEKAAQLRAEADNWQKGSLILSMVAGGLSAPTDALGGIIAYTLAPAVSYEIGQYFKAAGTEGSMSHIVAHMVLAGAVAAAGGNDVLSAALAAGGAEMVIPVLSQFLYGTTDPEKLTVSQKDTLIALSALTGGAIGGLVGDSTVSGLAGMSAAQTATEQNYLTHEEIRQLERWRAASAEGNYRTPEEEIERQNLTGRAWMGQCDAACVARLRELNEKPQYVDLWDWHINANWTGGTGKTGGTAGFQFTPDGGIYFYSGVGIGYGKGYSLTVHTGRPTPGLAVTGTVSGGNRFGGLLSATYDSAGTSYGGGFGLGVGHGGAVTGTMTIELLAPRNRRSE